MFRADVDFLVNGPDSEEITIRERPVRGNLRKSVNKIMSGHRQVRVRTWIFFTKETDFVLSLKSGDRAVIRGESYIVEDTEEDGLGGTEIFFDAVRATDKPGRRRDGTGVW